MATAVDSISAITEENSSNAEEMAASAEELSAQAQRMQGLVEQFKISTSQGMVGGSASTKPQESWGGSDQANHRAKMIESGKVLEEESADSNREAREGLRPTGTDGALYHA